MAGSKQVDGLTPKQRAFLAAYRVCCQLSRAARAAGCSPNNHHAWLTKSENYRKAFVEAHVDVAFAIEQEVVRRAMDGERELVLYQGVPVFVWTNADGEIWPEKRSGYELTPVYKTTRSDSLLLALAKAKIPDQFKDRVESTINASVALSGRANLYLPAQESDDSNNPSSSDDGNANDHPATPGTAGAIPGIVG